MQPEILHHKDECRFETVVDGYTAYVEYVITDNTIDIIHTKVPREIGGRGIAATLVKATYEYGDLNGWLRKATCPYAAAWLKRQNETNE